MGEQARSRTRAQARIAVTRTRPDATNQRKEAR